ncbi:MAG: hypothetical protein AB1547_00935 [Thermodesulfobacteriota bacterium]
MIHELPSQELLRELCKPWLASLSPQHVFRVYTDTSDFYAIEYGDILLLNHRLYLVRHNAKEGRFGLDDEVKFWVKRVIDLQDGVTRIAKLVFFERFTANIGGIPFECFRSPRKEARILDLVKGHPHFMQGSWVTDDHDNVVRIIDVIYGQSLAAMIEDIHLDHETYFHQRLPEILDHYIACVEAIAFLHQHGEKHGDIRRDHILVDRDSGRYRWIDFDFNFLHRENMFGYDLFGLGNVLIYIVGKGDILIQALRDTNPSAFARLNAEDVNIVFNNRVANLRKIFPYIQEPLNAILLRFSKGNTVFYDDVGQFLSDLREARALFQNTANVRRSP